MFVFELGGVEASYVEQAPFRFENVVEIAAPASTVFDVIVDGDQEGNWFPDFESCRWTSEAPHGVGSTREYALSYMRLSEEFLVWERPRHVVFRVTRMSLPLATAFLEDYRLDPAGADGRSTRLTWNVCYSPNPFLRALHPLLRPLFRRDFARAAAALKAYVERTTVS